MATLLNGFTLQLRDGWFRQRSFATARNFPDSASGAGGDNPVTYPAVVVGQQQPGPDQAMALQTTTKILQKQRLTRAGHGSQSATAAGRSASTAAVIDKSDTLQIQKLWCWCLYKAHDDGRSIRGRDWRTTWLGLQPEIFRITASKLFGVPFVCVIPIEENLEEFCHRNYYRC